MNQQHTSCTERPHAGVPFHIAIVEDETIVRRALERLLRASGFRVSTFPSAEAFLARGADAPDCMVLDLHLGGMSGLDLQAALAIKREQMPWVVVTAHDSPITRARCLEAGAAAYLVKPVEEWELIGAIQRAVGDSPAAGCPAA